MQHKLSTPDLSRNR